MKVAQLSLLALVLLVSRSKVNAGPLQFEPEDIENKGREVLARFSEWKSKQEPNSDKSFKGFLESSKGESDQEQDEAKNFADILPPVESYFQENGKLQTVFTHDNGELNQLYEEWKKAQTSDSGKSFAEFIDWLQKREVPKENALQISEDFEFDYASQGRRICCRTMCICCPSRCYRRCWSC